MPIKRVLITHTSRKGFLGKGLEHYLRNGLRSVSLAVPKIDHRKISSHIIFQNIMDCEVPRFCEIRCEILISQNIMCFGKILWKDFSKIFSKIVSLISKSFLFFWKILIAKGFWAEFFEEFYTAASRIIGMFENFILSWILACTNYFLLDFLFCKFKVSFSCSKRFYRASSHVQLGKGK